MSVSIRLLADDLTGALDTAAELVPLAGPIPVVWESPPAEIAGSCAFDSGTREASPERAAAVVAGLAPALAGGALAYKKLDSLLRGATMAEIAACLRHGTWERCIVAPAFPHQGRVTRGGIQYARRPDGTWAAVADIVAALAEAGVAASLATPDGPLPAGASVFDAETDADLRVVAATGHRAGGRLLWCGSAGLALALAHGAARPARIGLRGPVLGLFGSDQDATARQLGVCGSRWLRLAGPDRAADLVRDRLVDDGVALVSLDLPAGIGRAEAAARIARTFADLVGSLDRPGTLLVAGGETLRATCETLGATSLEVRGQFEPGLPHSVMRGGRWDGLTVVSKSGAFGGPNLWRDLLADLPVSAGRTAEKVHP